MSAIDYNYANYEVFDEAPAAYVSHQKKKRGTPKSKIKVQETVLFPNKKRSARADQNGNARVINTHPTVQQINQVCDPVIASLEQPVSLFGTLTKELRQLQQLKESEAVLKAELQPFLDQYVNNSYSKRRTYRKEGLEGLFNRYDDDKTLYATNNSYGDRLLKLYMAENSVRRLRDQVGALMGTIDENIQRIEKEELPVFQKHLPLWDGFKTLKMLAANPTNRELRQKVLDISKVFNQTISDLRQFDVVPVDGDLTWDDVTSRFKQALQILKEASLQWQSACKSSSECSALQSLHRDMQRALKEFNGKQQLSAAEASILEQLSAARPFVDHAQEFIDHQSAKFRQKYGDPERRKILLQEVEFAEHDLRRKQGSYDATKIASSQKTPNDIRKAERELSKALNAIENFLGIHFQGTLKGRQEQLKNYLKPYEDLLVIAPRVDGIRAFLIQSEKDSKIKSLKLANTLQPRNVAAMKESLKTFFLAPEDKDGAKSFANNWNRAMDQIRGCVGVQVERLIGSNDHDEQLELKKSRIALERLELAHIDLPQ